MRIAVIIPSRYKSTRFQGKPLALINGKPMIQHVYERSKQSKLASDVVVATDDNRISDAVNAFGGEVVLTSEKHNSGTDRLAEAALKIGLKPDDIVINVQGDQPLIDYRCLDQVVEPFKNEKGIKITTLGFKIINPDEITNPKDVKVVSDQNGFALYFSRASIPFGRDSDMVFDTYKHLGVYAYTREFLETFNALPEGKLESIEKLEQLRALEYGHPIRLVITEYDSPEVDLPEDILRIEKLEKL